MLQIADQLINRAQCQQRMIVKQQKVQLKFLKNTKLIIFLSSKLKMSAVKTSTVTYFSSVVANAYIIILSNMFLKCSLSVYSKCDLHHCSHMADEVNRSATVSTIIS